ncbi:MAG: threonylcarbamoyl-AMP synthase [Anaerolineaceae bacterium]|nr:threonylcarbamoyl-AMP synthase [Anaerolineaceae bacterium]
MIETAILATNDPQAIPTASQFIAEGGLIAFPTDTIYGVAGDPFNPESLKNIYQAKERPDEKALPVLVGALEQLTLLVSSLPPAVEAIARAFWPGPLTLVLPKHPGLPPELSAYPTVGVRMPDHPFTLALLQQTGPLATTSANISGGQNPTTAQDVLAQLGGRIDLVLDGGPTPGPTASTVADVSSPPFKILREGPISLSALQNLSRQD